MGNKREQKPNQLKKALLTAGLVLCFAAAAVAGLVRLQRMAKQSVNDERMQQLQGLTAQLSATFTAALEFNSACVGTVANLLERQSYANVEQVEQAIGDIEQTVLTGADERTFFLLDENGVCYDKSGSRGVWGDFDQVVGMEDERTFVADSVNYDGVYWAFVSKLSSPVTTQDGEVTIQYAVLLKPVEYMASYYASEAYSDECEVYILRENGTRMYDSVTETDIIQAYNIYKELRASNSQYGASFDTVLQQLESDGVACGNYETNGVEYCYSLAWQSEYDFVLLFLLPADAVAVNTVDMLSTMMWVFFGVSLLVLALALLTSFAMQRLANSRKLAQVKEQNLREQEQINLKLEQSNAMLEKAQKATESALDIARSANRAKTAFLSNMSHDIRTPLNAIIGFETLLEHDADDPAKVREYSGKIAVSSRHLLSLINDILDMSRIESGKTTLSFESFAVGELLGQIETVIQPQALQKRQSFEISAGGLEGCHIRADRLRLNQIMLNLLSNAVKYTPEGGHIQLMVQQAKPPQNQKIVLRFVVKDDGIGMSEAFQERIYEPFVREQNSTMSGIPGTGLGMAITKSLVDLMGGIITLESEPDKGSTFTVELTFTLENTAGAAAPAEPAAESTAATKGALDGRHFLIAEDNELNAEIIRSLLELENATCQIVQNGRLAVDVFTASPPHTFDAILMDIQMPVMDGYEATRLIRASAHPEALTIPIAAMTANAFADDVQRALDSGMNAHIAKPIQMERLREFMACM